MAFKLIYSNEQMESAPEDTINNRVILKKGMTYKTDVVEVGEYKTGHSLYLSNGKLTNKRNNILYPTLISLQVVGTWEDGIEFIVSEDGNE